MKLTLVRCLASVSLVAAMLSGAPASAQTGTSKEPRSLELNNDAIAAKWKAGDLQYALQKTGASMVTISGRECPGTWVLRGETVTISPKKWNWKKADPCSLTRVLEVVTVSADGMDVIDAATRTQLHLVRQQ